MQKLWHSLLAAGRKGFTMVELLVVVAILGILAVVAISALDPVEQINKGRDTTARADATELAQGIDRWYANTQMFPWNDPDTTANTSAAARGTANASTAFTMNSITGMTGTATDTNKWDFVGIMETGGELKTGFKNRVSNSRQFLVYKNANSSVTEVCFLPTSKAFKKEATTRCGDANLKPVAGGMDPCGSATTPGYLICVP